MNRLDKGITLPRRRGPKAARRKSVRGGLCLRLIPLTLAAAVTMNVIPANANPHKMNLKLYAYNKLNWSEFQCFNWLIHYESRWDHKAINGSHYGLAQMRNKKVKYLNGYQQIDWHLRYLKHRYNGDACVALDHLESKGWH